MWWLEVLFPLDWQPSKAVLIDYIDLASIINVYTLNMFLTNDSMVYNGSFGSQCSILGSLVEKAMLRF